MDHTDDHATETHTNMTRKQMTQDMRMTHAWGGSLLAQVDEAAAGRDVLAGVDGLDPVEDNVVQLFPGGFGGGDAPTPLHGARVA